LVLRFVLQELGILLGVSDWWRHLRKHLGTKVAQFSNLKEMNYM